MIPVLSIATVVTPYPLIHSFSFKRYEVIVEKALILKIDDSSQGP